MVLPALWRVVTLSLRLPAGCASGSIACWLSVSSVAASSLMTARVARELNAAHPFREGNGRTQRAFLRQLAATGGYRLELSQL